MQDGGQPGKPRQQSDSNELAQQPEPASPQAGEATAAKPSGLGQNGAAVGVERTAQEEPERAAKGSKKGKKDGKTRAMVGPIGGTGSALRHGEPEGEEPDEEEMEVGRHAATTAGRFCVSALQLSPVQHCPGVRGCSSQRVIAVLSRTVYLIVCICCVSSITEHPF